MNHSSLLLQIPQPSTPTYRNGVSSNSPMPQEYRLSPQPYKPNPKRFSRSTITLHSHHNSPKIFVNGDRLPILRDLCSNNPATPTSRKIAVTEEEIEELSRSISGLYLEGRVGRQRGLNSPTTNSKQRRFNVSSTTTRGGSAGLFGGLIRRPGRFKVRTVVLGGGATKVENK
ncbi:hypothetical protein FH972_016543 [Carpinus fangiana]|uniref:Uncharacterized protein n=1 Tax=Carpinus fangiana TaxID=176857 RepID=A0A5N6RIA7_9ROSI|nr:hypothetical protein FH972_016543 [Carpinus fangiana]